MRRMSNAYYAFFTLPTMVAFVIAFFIPLRAGYLFIIYQIHHSDQCTLGGSEQLCSRIH